MRCLQPQTILQSEELSLAITAFLHDHEGQSVRRVSRHCVGPRARRALAWRAKLSECFVILEVALRLFASQGRTLVPLAQLRSACAAAMGAAKDELSDLRIGQVLAVARGMLEVRRCSGLVLVQMTRNELGVPSPAELPRRFEQFEATLAQESEALACGRVPSMELRAPRGRCLSRQGSVCMPSVAKGSEARLTEEITVRILGERTLAHQRAREVSERAKQWRQVVRGANAACRQLRDTAEPVTVDGMMHRLTRRGACGKETLTGAEADSAIALLLLKGSGWVTARNHRMSKGHRNCLALVPASASTSAVAMSCVEALGRALARLEASDGPVAAADAAACRALALFSGMPDGSSEEQ